MRLGWRRGSWLAGLSLALACGRAPAAPPATPPITPEPAAASPREPAAFENGEAAAERALAQSRYADAEAGFRALLAGGEASSARLGLARVLMLTGRHAEARDLLRAALGRPEAPELEAATLLAESLRQTGAAAEAMALLERVRERPLARRARLLLGELRLERGRRQEAEEVLMTLIEDYNADRITERDGPGLAMVGRAAHLLRSPHDANDAFNAAERAAPGDPQTLLWRAELFLEKHDPGHAEEVVSELLARAPDHPGALVWMAHVKLEQALDFDAARQLAERALNINPTLPHAYFVLAGLEIRDFELDAARALIDRGLETNPEHLDLISLRAAVAFLAEDQSAFESARNRVLGLHPTYSRFYSIVGQFAEWEHRYDRIVEMMQRAVALDDEDAGAHAALGLNLIRAGQEAAGVTSLRRAFAKDPFNVRVFNTLNLFEEIIPEGYVSRPAGRFVIRYPKHEADLLQRYVPPLLDRAFERFSALYGFTPSAPLGIELYAEREHFAVRTSGLPQTAIQGVCFGKTLASLTPRHESFNLGMTLWHELAHVFHIQMSDSHVPRWLTEGLAEYETLIERPEWRRHHDPDLFAAARAGRLPKVAAMNRAFSHAEDIHDMATAYYASSRIAVMLVERYGRDAVNELLRLQARGVSSARALSEALGATPAQVEQEFSTYLHGSLGRYRQQFVPMVVRGELSEHVSKSEAAPGDVTAKLRVVWAALGQRQLALAKRVLAEARTLDAASPDVGFAAARVALLSGKRAQALAELRALAAAGHDGYAVQMAIAGLTDEQKQPAELRVALRRAHELDPTQTEPLTLLWQLAQRAKDAEEELRVLELLAPLSSHDGAVYRRLLELLLAKQDYTRAVQVGEAAIYVDLEGASTHALYARALAGLGRHQQAEFEFQSAALCPSRPVELARAQEDYAKFLAAQGRAAEADAASARARELAQEGADTTTGEGGTPPDVEPAP